MEDSASSSNAGEHEVEIKQEPSPKVVKVDKAPMPKCDAHPDVDCFFWCNDCILAICMQCADNSHETHHLKLLRHFLKFKVKESIKRLDHFKANIDKLNKNISQCDDEIEFHKNALSDAKERKRTCEEKRRYLSKYDEHLPVFQKVADDENENKDVDIHVLGDFLKILSKNDNDLFHMQSSVLTIGELNSMGTFNDGNRDLCIAGVDFAFQLHCQFHYANGGASHIFLLKCSRAKHWPVAADVRLAVANCNWGNELAEKLVRYIDKRQTASKMFFETIFGRICVVGNMNDMECHMSNNLLFANTRAECELEPLSNLKKCFFVIEIRAH